MKLRAKLWVLYLAAILLVLLIISASLLLYTAQLDPVIRAQFKAFLTQHYLIFLLPLFFIIALTALAFRWVLEKQVVPLYRLSDALNIWAKIHPGHRLPEEGGEVVRRFSKVFNSVAAHFEDLQENLESKISDARADLEEEKNTLAALIEELNEGVVVCNLENRILLYNQKARLLLDRAAVEDPADRGGPVGLGRPIYGVVDQKRLSHALGNLKTRLNREEGSHAAQLVMYGATQQLLRCQVIPVRDAAGELGGYILVFYDITHKVKVDSHRSMLLKSLTEGIRSALASIRAAIETLTAFPAMDDAKRVQFYRVIGEEAAQLSGFIHQTASEFSEHFKSQWPLENIPGGELIGAIRKSAAEKLNLEVDWLPGAEELWVRAESYSLVQAYLYMMRQLQARLNVGHFRMQLAEDRLFNYLDLSWEGAPISLELLETWKRGALMEGEDGIALTLQELLDRHDAEIWSHNDSPSNTCALRLAMPRSVAPQLLQGKVVLEGERPEFYDFSLFHQPGQTPELDQRLLSNLTYSVFDTETTGLNPSEGDEIISIGAVRIVNGRLLRKEIFDQLINPRRTMSREAVEVHGIEPAMLRDQPAIETVLPGFRRFVEDTVLVAHNAAFDMRFLKMKEELTGIRFLNPVLDTLLLSAAVHPNLERHNLDAIARRLGITVVGRHTALGDALVTAEILIKLIPLLAEMGIHTLQQAREASQKTLYARLQY